MLEFKVSLSCQKVGVVVFDSIVQFVVGLTEGIVRFRYEGFSSFCALTVISVI